MEEDKSLICKKIFELLKSTRYYSGVQSMLYVYNWDNDKNERINETAPEEYILVKYDESDRNNKCINVSGDSGFAMIQDVLRYI